MMGRKDGQFLAGALLQPAALNQEAIEMSDDTVFIGYGGGFFATVWGGKQSWGARTPAELIAKLDASGIDRARLELIEGDRFSCPDHALDSKDAQAFRAILGIVASSRT
jgi:hypothetical protein